MSEQETRMNLGELIDVLAEAPDDLPVTFEWPGIIPVGIGSWRGHYAELSLWYAATNYALDRPTVKAVRADWEKMVGATLTGWKGGEFLMTRRTPVWVDNDGEYTRRGIRSVIVGKLTVVIHTFDTDDHDD